MTKIVILGNLLFNWLEMHRFDIFGKNFDRRGMLASYEMRALLRGKRSGLE